MKEEISSCSEFNVTVFVDDAIFLDLIDNMGTDAWQSAVGILICMALISFIFLYDPFTVAVVSAAIISIMTGLLLFELFLVGIQFFLT